MKINKFEEIISWKKAKELNIIIYSLGLLKNDHSFRDQLQRASVSIMNNIAEGYERQTNKEFRNFLYIAKGSCGELRSMLYLALELHYISQKEFDNLYSISIEISKLLSGLIKTL